jgi:hypothetical protein
MSKSLKGNNMSKSEVIEAGTTNVTASAEPDSELDQLRHIVFGAAKTDLDAQIHNLQAEMRNGFKQISETLEQYISEVHSTIQENVSSLDDRISQVDDHYDSKLSLVDKKTDELHDSIESNSQAIKQQDDDIHKRVGLDIDNLTNEFTQKHNQTIDLLNQMKAELNSSKTDKKTLAKLLATVASNLEIED